MVLTASKGLANLEGGATSNLCDEPLIESA